ncbi:hypothetical protein [Desulfovibrio intestinalis]|uniref:3-hydroxyacyl-CoA dehydrogenase n=1 Tax=Desulfovibrio intestinalis TaxID=58621 RepID=A0A7W8C6L3_9BACT|nr:hypothetical protein [Desulfovibrio intestinalis]MBB5144735.1 3-hydroxyacyl-CoA dehydrogenase [Desulfovibrio intestinalis]
MFFFMAILLMAAFPLSPRITLAAAAKLVYEKWKRRRAGENSGTGFYNAPESAAAYEEKRAQRAVKKVAWALRQNLLKNANPKEATDVQRSREGLYAGRR